MTELILIVALILVSMLGVRFLPFSRYIKYIFLGVSIVPLAYFYVIKEYYIDHAANTAGAYILFSSICLFILLNELKHDFEKLSVVLMAFQTVDITAAICIMWRYGTKVSIIALIVFIILLVPGVLRKTVLSNIVLYRIYVVSLLLGPIGVRLITHGNHDGLTYVYTEYGMICFLIMIMLLGYWLFNQFEYACRNRNSEVVFSGITVSFILLWLNPCMIQIPLVLFILVFGYVIKTVEYDYSYLNIVETTKNILGAEIMSYSKKDKMLIGILLYLEFAISIFLLGPLEIYAGNSAELYFGVESFIPYALIVIILMGIVSAIVVWLLKDKAFGTITTMVFSLEVAMYVQTMFMNIKLQEPNGNAMDWESVSWFTPINTIAWVGILLTCVILCISAYGKWIVKYASLFLTLIQTTAVVAVLISSLSAGRKVNSVFLSDTEYTLAKEENIIVFILDCTARDYLDSVRAKDPNALDDWNDFTEYRNENSDCARTFPSITHMITGYEYDENEQGWRQNAWDSESCVKFTDMLHDSGYVFNLYTKETLNIGSFDEVNGKIDNIQLADPQIDCITTTRLLLKASIYRELPYVLKPFFEVFSYMYDEVATFEAPCPYQNYDYYDRLVNERLKISDTLDKQLSITHIIGTHGPKCSNERAEQVESSSYDETVRGLIFIIDEYLNQLKELGKYDDSTIIITADHSDNMEHPQPIYFIKKSGEHHKEIPVSMAPIAHLDFQGTVADIIGRGASYLGRKSIWDYKEGESRKRVLQGEVWDGFKNIFFYTEYEGGQKELVTSLKEIGIIH